MTPHVMASKYRYGLITLHAVTRVMAYCFYVPVIAQTANPTSSLYGTTMLNEETVRRLLTDRRKNNAEDQITDQHGEY
jgi:YbbR domain-containing protein